MKSLKRFIKYRTLDFINLYYKRKPKYMPLWESLYGFCLDGMGFGGVCKFDETGEEYVLNYVFNKLSEEVGRGKLGQRSP